MQCYKKVKKKVVLGQTQVVGVRQLKTQPNVVQAGQEVESVPVPLLQRLLSWPHWQHPSLLQPRLVDQDGVGVDGEGVDWGPSYTPLFMGSMPVSWSSICLLMSTVKRQGWSRLITASPTSVRYGEHSNWGSHGNIYNLKIYHNLISWSMHTLYFLDI